MLDDNIVNNYTIKYNYTENAVATVYHYYLRQILQNYYV